MGNFLGNYPIGGMISATIAALVLLLGLFVNILVTEAELENELDELQEGLNEDFSELTATIRVNNSVIRSQVAEIRGYVVDHVTDDEALRNLRYEMGQLSDTWEEMIRTGQVQMRQSPRNDGTETGDAR